jgi:hypothetical protein
MGEYLFSEIQDQIESSSRQLRDDLDRLSNEAGRIFERALDPFGLQERVLRSPLASCGAAFVSGILVYRLFSRRSRRGRDYSLAAGEVAKRPLIGRALDNLGNEAWSAISRGGQRAIWRAIFGS